MIVRVTKEHINDGDHCESRSCPVARAINEQLLPGMFATIGDDDVTVYTNISKDFILGCGDKCEDCLEGEEIELGTFPLPKRAQQFVARFDGKKPVKPFSFEL